MQKRPSGSWVDEQSTERTYFENGLLKQLTSRNASGTVVEQHTLDYITSSVYVNGNRVKDVFKLAGPDPAASCHSATCTATWTYDARERVTQEVSGTGNTTDFTLDAVGNVTLEKVNAVTTRTAVYSGQQLLTEDAGGTNRRFFYDVLGNQDCVTTITYAGTHCPGPSADLVEDPIYDYKNRLSSFRKYSGGALDRKTDYTNDPLDRPVKLVEWNGSTTTTTDLVYIGISNAVAKETLTGGTNTTKTYAYDPLGRRVTMSEGTLPHRYSYLNDPHGSVSMVLENDNTVKAAYGYTGYGSPNSSLTKLAAGFSADTNLYRYSAKRFDTNSDSYDMGARRYSASRGRFIQRDVYGDALANLGLSEDPLTGNRYALAAGNPVNFIEIDGHRVIDSGGGGNDSDDEGGGDGGAPEMPDLEDGVDEAYAEYVRSGSDARRLSGRDDDYCNSLSKLSFEMFRRCWVASRAREYAENVTEFYVQIGALEDRHIDDESNAFKHSLWNAIMTIYMGEEDAEYMANLHEAAPATAGNLSPKEQRRRRMDLNNNAVGRLTAMSVMASGSEGKAAVMDAMKILLRAASTGTRAAGRYLRQLNGSGGSSIRAGTQ